MNYLKWKRVNITVRGVKESIHTPNGVCGLLGQGLYTCPISNKEMAAEYGQLYFVYNGKPKNPKKFQYLNSFEIWSQKHFSKKRGVNLDTMKEVLIDFGFDGIEITGREFVNFKPENVRYFENENQLKQFFEMLQERKLIN